jgi:7-cyano-7-deazaguanine reductase
MKSAPWRHFLDKFSVTQETASDDVAAKVLGQRVAAPTTYTPEILVRIPRSENREQYAITNELFRGQDNWYCYECSTLTNQGIPVYFGMVITVPYNSEYIVESKSLKLYLNSFNMESLGDTIWSTKKEYLRRVGEDLSKLLETDVEACAMDDWQSYSGFTDLTTRKDGCFVDLASIVDFNRVGFVQYNEDPELLCSSPLRAHQTLNVYYNGFRSNCKVTHQPDYATVFIGISSQQGIDPTSLAAYLTSFRNESHFHEECVEAIFKRLTAAFHPTDLFVRANYTRRGGIDINPTRIHPKTERWSWMQTDLSMTVYQ